MSSTSSNHVLTNQRTGSRSQAALNGQSPSSSASTTTTNHASIYQTPSSSTSASSSTLQNNQNQKSKTQQQPKIHNHTSNNPSHTHSSRQAAPINYLSKSSPKDQESSVSIALHKLSQHHAMQQTNPLIKQRTYSTSAISSVNTNFQNNQLNLSNLSNRMEDLTKLGTSLSQATQHNNITSNNTNNNGRASLTTHRQLLQDQLDRDSEETTIKEEEYDNQNEGFKETELEALGSLERNLPVELSFLIRQQAYCMAKMNYLDRQIRELQEVRENQQQQQQQQSYQFQQQQQQHHNNQHRINHNQYNYHNLQPLDSTPIQMTTSSATFNQRLHQTHHSNRLINNSTAQAAQYAATATTKNGNFILSDDSGGEYSRATISDDDELSSLLDQIARSVKPDNQSRGSYTMNGVTTGGHPQQPSHSMPVSHQQQISSASQSQYHPRQQQNQQAIHDQTSLAANFSAIHNSQLQQQHHQQAPPPTQHQHQHQHQQQFAIINPNQIHHQQQTVPIFVMGSPIVPVAPHPSSINSNILPGIHFQPEPRYNQYYEDLYCNNPSQNAIVASTNVPSGFAMMMPNKQHQFVTNQHPIHSHNYQQQQQYLMNHPHLVSSHQSSYQQQQQQQQQQQIIAGSKSSQQQQQFDHSITAIEQLVGQKEKRQIMSQLKSADNWLKMRSSAGVTATSSSSIKANQNESSLNSGGSNGKFKSEASTIANISGSAVGKKDGQISDSNSNVGGEIKHIATSDKITSNNNNRGTSVAVATTIATTTETLASTMNGHKNTSSDH